jgi:pimeloyl-ACP methyl ester carboxylesterase
MKKLSRHVLFGVGGLIFVVLAIVTVEFILTRGDTPKIVGSQSIASLEKLELGGVAQWVLIRGHDSRNPVLLFLHGGPGMPVMFLAHAFQSELERDFVVVHWDRRGAGESFDAALDGTSLNVSQTLADTYELTRILHSRFAQDRVYLVGHSWGSYLGLLALRDHPEYYSAFVGLGQLAGTWPEVQEARRDFLIGAAREAGDRGLSASITSGDHEVTENDLFRYGGELHGARSFWPILRTGLFAPEYTLFDALNVKRGADLVAREMDYDVSPKPLEGEILDFDVPVFFFLGRYDYNTPSQLAAGYLDRLRCPLKELVWFENSAHFPFFEEPDRFHTEMVRIDQSVHEFWAARSSDPGS